MDDLARAIAASAGRLGIDPVDLGTVISYETAGTFDPWKAGPTTQWGQHRGLIQWGEPQRAKYGVTPDMPVAAQLQAAEHYLTDAGVRPGMGLMDLYSAVNAGHVGRYNASDANNGGAPGTVRDKVENQMGGHREKAMALLQGMVAPTQAGPTPVAAAAPPSGMAVGAAPQIVPGADLASLFALTMQNHTARQQAADEQAAAEEQRRAALLGGDVSGLFG